MNVQSLQVLSQKKVTRKEFLLYIGLVLLALSGINHILSSFTGASHSFLSNKSQGFGSGSYGGKEKA